MTTHNDSYQSFILYEIKGTNAYCVMKFEYLDKNGAIAAAQQYIDKLSLQICSADKETSVKFKLCPEYGDTAIWFSPYYDMDD